MYKTLKHIIVFLNVFLVHHSFCKLQQNISISVLTDIDINTCEDSSSIETPSITSYKMSDDIFCIQPPSLRGMGSFRSNVGSTSSTIRTYGKKEEAPPKQYFKFRGEWY